MRRLMQLTFLAVCLSSTVGCFVPIYSTRPERRVQQLLYTSEDMRSLVDEWERFWFLESPSHLTPVRTHGAFCSHLNSNHAPLRTTGRLVGWSVEGNDAVGVQ